jgi:hypothetical protein
MKTWHEQLEIIEARMIEIEYEIDDINDAYEADMSDESELAKELGKFVDEFDILRKKRDEILRQIGK